MEGRDEKGLTRERPEGNDRLFFSFRAVSPPWRVHGPVGQGEWRACWRGQSPPGPDAAGSGAVRARRRETCSSSLARLCSEAPPWPAATQGGMECTVYGTGAGGSAGQRAVQGGWRARFMVQGQEWYGGRRPLPQSVPAGWPSCTALDLRQAQGWATQQDCSSSSGGKGPVHPLLEYNMNCQAAAAAAGCPGGNEALGCGHAGGEASPLRPASD